MRTIREIGLRDLSARIARVVSKGLPLLAVCIAAPAHASFHFMQIEQVIGGVNGDTTAQAIQLRMRAVGQNFVSGARLRAFDATGANPVLLINFTTNVANAAAGARVLVATPAFANYVSPALAADFTMSQIPASYLAAGRILFEDDFGTIYWSLSFGGAGYTGSTTGFAANDADGNFGPPFGGPCPSTTLQALRFQGAASALSTTNEADYALTTGAAVFANNAGTNFTVSIPPVTITQWRSLLPHGGLGELAIVLNPTATGNGSSGPTVEPRSAGIRKIEADFNAPMTLTGTPAAGITISDGTNSYSPTSVAAVDSNTIALLFDPGVLPDQICYTINIGAGTVTQPIAGDSNCMVRALAGDTTGNGTVNLTDMLFTMAKASSSTSAGAAPEHDVNLTGGDIDLADALFIKPLVTSPASQALCP